MTHFPGMYMFYLQQPTLALAVVLALIVVLTLSVVLSLAVVLTLAVVLSLYTCSSATLAVVHY